VVSLKRKDDFVTRLLTIARWATTGIDVSDTGVSDTGAEGTIY